LGDGLYIAASGALARLRDLDIVANNLANADTIGFKRDRPVFQAVLESSLSGEDAAPIAGAPGRSFASVDGVASDFASGAAASTGGALDVALRGRGFFEVETPAGPRYTRAGAFQVAADGTLVTSGGLPVQGDGGPLQTGGRAAQLLASGELVDERGVALGRLRVVDFASPERLIKEGEGLYRSADGLEPETLESFELLPGSLEQSNVEPVRELAALVVLQRAFDAAMRTLTADDQTTRQLIQEVSG
jgi:flagellar basal body rod protein FlgG